MKSIAVTEFKARCLALLEDVARTGEPIVVTKHGRPLARVTSTPDVQAVRPQDTLAGSVSVTGDITSPVLPRTAWRATRRR